MFARLIHLLLGLTVVVALRPNKFYRRDYTYVEQFDAFYKLHWDPAGQSWSSAFRSCDEEDATLFYPKTKEEWVVAKSLVATMKVKPNVTDIFIGIHDTFRLAEFMTVDGLPTASPLPDKEQEADSQDTCVVMEIETGDYKLESCQTQTVKPFVCRKVEEAVPSCPTIDRGYIYNKNTRKCFKISKRQKTWADALQTCFMEGGILALVTDLDKSKALFDILSEENKRSPQQRDQDVPFFTGFRRFFADDDFYTVTGHRYDDNYYKIWRSTIYGDKDDKRFDCGVTYKYNNGVFTTGTRGCLEPARFICEMEVNA